MKFLTVIYVRTAAQNCSLITTIGPVSTVYVCSAYTIHLWATIKLARKCAVYIVSPCYTYSQPFG